MAEVQANSYSGVRFRVGSYSEDEVGGEDESDGYSSK